MEEPTMPLLLTRADLGTPDALVVEQTAFMRISGDLSGFDELPTVDRRPEPPEVSRERVSKAIFVPISNELLRRVLDEPRNKRWSE